MPISQQDVVNNFVDDANEKLGRVEAVAEALSTENVLDLSGLSSVTSRLSSVADKLESLLGTQQTEPSSGETGAEPPVETINASVQ